MAKKYQKLRKTGRKNPARPSTMFKPGHKKIGGRKKGTPNKFSGELKQFVLNAMANARAHGQRAVGPQEYLEHQAKVNPKTFLGLIGKLLPTQLTGKDDGPIEVVMQRAQEGLAKLSDKDLAALQSILAKVGLTQESNP